MKKYINPEIDIVELDVEDITNTSGAGGNIGDNGEVILPDDEW